MVHWEIASTEAQNVHNYHIFINKPSYCCFKHKVHAKHALCKSGLKLTLASKL